MRGGGAKAKSGGGKRRKGSAMPLSENEKRVRNLRKGLHSPSPAPLRMARNRWLRHWTIHRAWQLFKAQQRRKQELEMERQYQSMHDACEELRTGAGDDGKLFRVSMNKKGIFTDMFPIEYARMQTESPPADGWNHDWKKPVKK